MSFLTRWFRKTEPEDYETILASLAIDIQKRQTRLSEIRLRERRATLLVTLYTLAAWAAYVSFWYMGLIPTTGLFGVVGMKGQGERVEKVVGALPVFVGPVLILFTRRIIQMYFTRKGDAEENTLKALYKEQRTKIEDIKKKTNYYNTRSLIERYDEGPVPGSGPGAGSPLRQRNVSGAPGAGVGQSPQRGQGLGPQMPSTPPRPGQGQGQGQGQNDALRTPMPMPLSPGLQTHLMPQPHQPIPHPRKQWYDKLADALLGDDEAASGPAASRYALICQKCFAHNGLVKEGMWEDAQYVCPKCGHFNPSARSLKQGGPGPASSTSSPQSKTASPQPGRQGQGQLGVGHPNPQSLTASGPAGGEATGAASVSQRNASAERQEGSGEGSEGEGSSMTMDVDDS